MGNFWKSSDHSIGSLKTNFKWKIILLMWNVVETAFQNKMAVNLKGVIVFYNLKYETLILKLM